MTGSLIFEMIKINGNDTRRINHALKVLGLAKCIAEGENADEKTKCIIEAAAVLHDIAIRFCEEKYGLCTGKQQEIEGPAIARPILERYTDDTELIERVIYLIAHHHTYTDVDGLDYSVLIEADFLVNTDEGDLSRSAFETVYSKYFRTETGRKIARMMSKIG